MDSTGEADLIVATDTGSDDDTSEQLGWRGVPEAAWSQRRQQLGERQAALRGKRLYNWSVKPDGLPGVQFHYLKAHKRHGFLWVCRYTNTSNTPAHWQDCADTLLAYLASPAAVRNS